jgi:hypothetical protein
MDGICAVRKKTAKKAEKKLKLNILFFFEQKNRMTYS